MFHVDFVTPANSTLGVGADHTPNALITVNPFVEAWTNTAGFSLVPQPGTAVRLQTLGDKIMTPLVYQNRSGTESLWADQTVYAEFPERADCCSLVSIQCYRRHLSCYAGSTTRLEQRQRWFVALYAQYSR